MNLSRSSTNGSSCLILHSDYPLQNQLYFLQLCDKKVQKIHTSFAKSMPEFTIIGSSNGLLCLVNTLLPDSIYLYNPFTRYYSELPNNSFKYYEDDHTNIVYGFGFHPVTNDYKVIKIGHYKIQIYSLNSNTWKSKSRVVLPYRLEEDSSPGVLVSVRLHWVSEDRFKRTIVSFDLADDSFHVIKNPVWGSGSSFGRWDDDIGCHLVSSDGYLGAAVPMGPGHGALDIWIMKEYGVDESWVKEYGIGAYSPAPVSSSMISRYKLETSNSHIWRNRKYLFRVLCVMENGEVVLEYRGRGLVSYDLRNGSFKEIAYPGDAKIISHNCSCW